MMSPINCFNKGDKIEVFRTTGDVNCNIPAWFPATVIGSSSPSGTLLVKFTTLFSEKDGKNGRRKRKKIREYVGVTDCVTERIPPSEPHRRFVVGEEVEVLYENGWRRGFVKGLLENCRCTVVIDGVPNVVVENRNVRVCDWKHDDGSRVSSTVDPLQEKSTPEPVMQHKRPTKLRIICSKRDSKADILQKGARVEVRTDEEGYHGARYVATVVGSVGENKVLVQYDTLTTDDQKQLLVEMADVSNITPLPPIISREHFKMLEEVDAYYHDGWWMGVVTKVLAKLKCVVYFWTTNEELKFQYSNLRPHQELINEKWVASCNLRPKPAENPILKKMKLQTGGRTLKVDLLCGLKLEIAHGAGRFLSTWYPAVILRPVSNGKYLVEYRTLKAINRPQLIEEAVDALCISPLRL